MLYKEFLRHVSANCWAGFHGKRRILITSIYIVGGMGSGKSSVLRFFQKNGVRGFDLDELASEVREIPEVISELESALGISLAGANSTAKREILAKSAFLSRENRRKVEGILHPKVLELLAKKKQQLFNSDLDSAPASSQIVDSKKYIAVEVSAFKSRKLSPYIGDNDIVLAVIASEDIRMGRIVAKGFSRLDAEKRIAMQPTNEEFAREANRVVLNDGSEIELQAKLEALLKELCVNEGD